RGVGLSVGRGGILWAYETMVPYYTASAHTAAHEAVIAKAMTELVTEAKALVEVDDGESDEASYRKVTELARTVQERHQRLPIKTTHFLTKLEPISSHDVRDEGFSDTQFIITPNYTRHTAHVPTRGQKACLGAVRVRGGLFKGSFDPSKKV